MKKKPVLLHPLMGVGLAFVLLASAWTAMIWIAVKNAPEAIIDDVPAQHERN